MEISLLNFSIRWKYVIYLWEQFTSVPKAIRLENDNVLETVIHIMIIFFKD